MDSLKNDLKCNKTVAIYTLGCRVNQYESSCIISEFIKLGFEIRDFSELCDVYIINTCTVTFASDKKSKQIIRRAKSLNNDAIIAVCGCFSQKNPEVFKEELQVDIIVGSFGKNKIAQLALEALQNRNNLVKNDLNNINNLVKDIAEYENYEKLESDFSQKTRAFIKIQDGCEAKCSYCIIPQVRGVEKSRSYSEIYQEIKNFNDLNYHEIVLTGIEIASYNDCDKLNFGLIDLIKSLNYYEELNNIKTIRLSSLDPAFITANFVDKMAGLSKFAPHIHASLQSGSSHVLGLMRRKYNAEKLLENLLYAKSKIKNLNITGDIIVGFPKESEQDFMQTVEVAKQLNLYHAHIFTYSKRAGTPAAEFDGQIAESIKIERSHELAKMISEIKLKIHEEQINKEFEVIIESLNVNKNFYSAKTRNFMDLKIKNNLSKDLIGNLVKIKVYDYDKENLFGEII